MQLQTDDKKKYSYTKHVAHLQLKNVHQVYLSYDYYLEDSLCIFFSFLKNEHGLNSHTLDKENEEKEFYLFVIV